MRAKKPVCGKRNGMDISIANSTTSPQSIIFSFFIIYSKQLDCKDMKKFIYLCSFIKSLNRTIYVA